MPLDNVIARSQSSTLACVRIKICPHTLADKAEHISVLVFKLRFHSGLKTEKVLEACITCMLHGLQLCGIHEPEIFQ